MKKLLILTILILSASAFKCGNDKAPQHGTVELSRNTYQVTENGARVYSQSGVSAAELAEIDRGLRDRAEIARQDGHTLGLNVDLYEIFIPKQPCVRSPVQQIWSFKVRADNYDGTEYDQDPRPGIGVVFASEMILSFGGSMVLCPQVAYEAAGNGADHIILGLNPNTYPDGLNYYYSTLTHTTIGHPLLPRQTAAVELSDEEKAIGEAARELKSDINKDGSATTPLFVKVN